MKLSDFEKEEFRRGQREQRLADDREMKDGCSSMIWDEILQFNHFFFPDWREVLPVFYSNAIAGEVGECCQEVYEGACKGHGPERLDGLIEELADVAIYTRMFAQLEGQGEAEFEALVRRTMREGVPHFEGPGWHYLYAIGLSAKAGALSDIVKKMAGGGTNGNRRGTLIAAIPGLEIAVRLFSLRLNYTKQGFEDAVLSKIEKNRSRVKRKRGKEGDSTHDK